MVNVHLFALLIFVYIYTVILLALYKTHYSDYHYARGDFQNEITIGTLLKFCKR